jgi:hypothetical protein
MDDVSRRGPPNFASARLRQGWMARVRSVAAIAVTKSRRGPLHTARPRPELLIALLNHESAPEKS